ncbi:MAG: large subunit ribosomal protein, partial [Miltoncostaeaceae bacterium]|nr:large subunit ribosomal protein [Miltoncostaeaceae bacterium]
QEDSILVVERPTDRGEHRALHGLYRSLVANMVEGVTAGFQKTLEIQGVGYRAALKGRDLELALGYSHPVSIKAPEGIEFEVPTPTRIIVKGNSKQVVGEIAANIRKKRPPEPYKGKGIRYEGELLVKRPTDRGEHRALHGLTRSLVANMVEGVTAGYAKTLEIQGVGYRAVLKGRDLELALGYSHPVSIKAPDGIDFEVPQPTRVVVRGISKQLVGEIAANIRKQRPPEPYKGKGIRYEGEYVARKVGKRA